MEPITAIAIVLWMLFFVVAFVARSWLQWKRTGDSGFRLSRTTSTQARIASILMTLGMLAGFAGAIGYALDLRTVTIPLGSSASKVAGLGVMVASIILTAKSQLDLRESWRIGVDDTEQTELVTDGIYATVRNPIFTGMFLFAVGGALSTPTWLSLAAIAVMFIGFELQVRRVEEPYLAKMHADGFRAYAARSGRFVPFVGRIEREGPLT